MNGKQLKNSILQWAIQGKLVPQDPNDEPAAVLLERIRAEKARLVKEGKIKKDKNESIIYKGDDNSYYEKFPDGRVVCIDDEIPFEIPQGWEWTRIRNVSQSYIGLTYSPGDVTSEGTIVLRSSNIKDGKLVLDDIVRVKSQIPEKLYVEENDILICARNGSAKLVGKAAIIPHLNEKMSFGAFMAICKTSIHKFVYLFLQSDLFFGQLREVSGTTTINQLTQNNFNGFLIPIPPIDEQERIVKKVSSITPILEKYSKSQEALDHLNQTVKKDIRNSILQEAIQGKLVTQEPSDEPASALLERIAAEKQRLVKEGKLKAKDALTSVIFKGDDNKYYEQIGSNVQDISEEIPFEIPENWAWTRLGNLVSNNAGLAYSKGDLDRKSDKPIRVLRGGNISDGSWAMRDDDVMIAPEFVNPKLLLRKGTFITPAVTSLERMGKTALISDDLDDTVVGGFVLMLVPYNLNDTILHYLLDFFQTIYYKQYCTSITNKSGQAFYNISRSKLMQCLVPIPSIREQQRIVQKIAEIQTLIQ